MCARTQLFKRVAQIGSELTAKYQGEQLMMVCILRGAVIFMADLVRAVGPNVDVSIEFIKASSYGASTVSSGTVAITQQTTLDVKGRHVLIVEDIVDTGRTLKRLREYFAEQGAVSVEVCVLLDKKDRRIVEVPVEYTGFSIPDEFVVGYGLDFDEKMRNLPAVYTVRQVAE